MPNRLVAIRVGEQAAVGRHHRRRNRRGKRCLVGGGRGLGLRAGLLGLRGGGAQPRGVRRSRRAHRRRGRTHPGSGRQSRDHGLVGVRHRLQFTGERIPGFGGDHQGSRAGAGIHAGGVDLRRVIPEIHCSPTPLIHRGRAGPAPGRIRINDRRVNGGTHGDSCRSSVRRVVSRRENRCGARGRPVSVPSTSVDLAGSAHATFRLSAPRKHGFPFRQWSSRPPIPWRQDPRYTPQPADCLCWQTCHYRFSAGDIQFDACAQ